MSTVKDVTGRPVQSKFDRIVPDPMLRFVSVEMLRAGQPRPYADHEYEAILTFKSFGNWASRMTDGPKGEEVVKKYIPLFVHPFKEKDDTTRGWHEPWLEKLEKIGPGKWHVLVKSPYLD